MSEMHTSSLGIIGMGLMGSAVMKMTGASCGWDVDASRCVNAVTANDVFGNCDVIFLSLPNSDIVRGELRGAALKPGQIIIDTTTGDPREMAALGDELAVLGVHYLDATVSGSSAQLLQRDVLVMVGGDADVFAQQLDLDLAQTLDVMRRSMAYSRIMDTKGEKMITQDFTPQAKLSQHLKDVRLMLAASAIPLPLSETHRELLEKAEALGYGEADNSAVIQAILKA
jgi:3-hydroxyisobutyrate dehydrogenase-like beta-hydroxyacid dehydrogenase